MNIVDVVVILIILMSGVIGFKRGVFKELVMTVGFLLVIIIAFKFKGPLALWMGLNLPFFNFGSVFNGISIINVIFYEFIAFMIIFSIIMIIFKIILTVTNIFEKILKYTIILGIPSKILGLLVGLIEGYIVAFLVMSFLASPICGDIANESKLKGVMLNKTPILTNVSKELNGTIIDIYNLKDKEKDPDVLEEEITKIMLNHKLVDKEYLLKLKDAGKIKVDKKVIEEY